MTILVENPVEKLNSAPTLVRGDWGDGVETVCLMSALVPGANDHTDCVTAGWPEWLARLCVNLYDIDTMPSEFNTEQEMANRWAYQVAEAVAKNIDYEEAHYRFLTLVLESVLHIDTGNVVSDVLELHIRALKGDTPSPSEWTAAAENAKTTRDRLLWFHKTNETNRQKSSRVGAFSIHGASWASSVALWAANCHVEDEGWATMASMSNAIYALRDNAGKAGIHTWITATYAAGDEMRRHLVDALTSSTID